MRNETIWFTGKKWMCFRHIYYVIVCLASHINMFDILIPQKVQAVAWNIQNYEESTKSKVDREWREGRKCYVSRLSSAEFITSNDGAEWWVVSCVMCSYVPLGFSLIHFTVARFDVWCHLRTQLWSKHIQCILQSYFS